MTFHETYAGLVEHNTERLAGIEERHTKLYSWEFAKVSFPYAFLCLWNSCSLYNKNLI